MRQGIVLVSLRGLILVLSIWLEWAQSQSAAYQCKSGQKPAMRELWGVWDGHSSRVSGRLLWAKSGL